MKDIIDFWDKFLIHFPKYKEFELPDNFHFCDDEDSANICADLVVKGEKRAACSMFAAYDNDEQELPQNGELKIVTDWTKKPKAVIEMTGTELKAFKDIDEKFAFEEGEGDKSLEYWRNEHINYFKKYKNDFSEEEVLVCEYFKTIYTDS